MLVTISTTEDTKDTEETSSSNDHLKSRREKISVAMLSTMLM
jgi:hypothetical protein